MDNWIKEILEEKRNLIDRIVTTGYIADVEKAGDVMTACISNGGKILLAGNGGSAADAQHFAGEIVGRFTMERKSLPAMSLSVDPSIVTCIANDYGYDSVFARQVEGYGNNGDILVVISTSGNSTNCMEAIASARTKGMKIIGFLGKNGGKIAEKCDVALVVPSDSTPRIQEIHTLTVHLLCETIERNIFGKG